MRSFSKVVLAFGIANKGWGNLERGHGTIQFFPQQKKGFVGFVGLSFVGFFGFFGFILFPFLRV